MPQPKLLDAMASAPHPAPLDDKRAVRCALGDRMSVWITSLGLGDTICATPTLRRLRKVYPAFKFDVYTYYPEVFAYNPNVDAVYRFEDELELNGHYRGLRVHGYARYFLTFFSSEHKPHIDYDRNSIVDTCSLIALGETLPENDKWLEAPVSEREMRSLHAKIAPLGIDVSNAVVIHPSITWPSRTWPPDRWQAVTDTLRADGYQVMAVGSTRPVIARRLEIENISMHGCPREAIDLIDKSTVLETLCLLRSCKAVITVESGLLHLALATDTPIVCLFSITHPYYRLAPRHGALDYNLAAVPPQGECVYCSHSDHAHPGDFRDCALGTPPPCLPDADTVYQYFKNLVVESQTLPIHKPKGGRMQQPNAINPDAICQQAIQAKLNIYQAKEHFETVLKMYNDQVDNLVNLVNLMKNRILELEGEAERKQVKMSPMPKEETVDAQ